MTISAPADSAELLPPDSIVLNPGRTAEAAVIWLHGLGADGNDFVPVAPQLQVARPVRYIFPHAPIRPVALNGNMPMRAWYDIAPDGGSSMADVLASAAQVELLLQQQLQAGIAPGRIVLAGFSQGGVIAQHLGFRQDHKLAGIMALSTYFPHAEESAGQLSEISKQTPLMVMHGTADPMIPLHRAQQSMAMLRSLGYQPEWRQYDMAHAVCPEQIQRISSWLKQQLD